MCIGHRKCIHCCASLFCAALSCVSDSAEALDIGTGKLFFCIAFLRSVFHCTSLSCIALREDFVDRNWKKRSNVASSDANVFFVVRLS